MRRSERRNGVKERKWKSKAREERERRERRRCKN